MQSSYAPCESHTNQDEIFFCILPYLNMQWLLMVKGFYPVLHPTRDLLRWLGLLKQGVTIFIITKMTWTQKNPQPSGNLNPPSNFLATYMVDKYVYSYICTHFYYCLSIGFLSLPFLQSTVDAIIAVIVHWAGDLGWGFRHSPLGWG